MYSVDQLLADPELLQRLIDEHRIFKQAIENSPLQFCVYDQDDTLIAWNEAYEEIHRKAFTANRERADKRQLKYGDIIRYQLPETMPTEQAKTAMQERIEAQRNADGTPVVRQYEHGEYLKVIKYRLPSGAVAGIAVDISDLKNREAELAEATRIAELAEQKSAEALKAEQMLQRATQLLSELDEWLQCCQSLEELFKVVSMYMHKLLPATSGELYIYSNSRDVLDGSCQWGVEAMLDHIAPDSCWALRRGRPYKYGTGNVGFVCGHVEKQICEAEGLKYLCLPIVAHGDTVGLLHIKFNERNDQMADESMPRRYSDMFDFAAQCAEHISLAIANVRLRDELRDQSIRDSLTGLYNRRYFLERLRNELRNAEKKGEHVGLITFDADRFKSFNDNHGHDAGDVILREIGDVIQTTFNGTEVACRYGGEEFNILIPSASAEQAKAAAEILRSNVEGLIVRYENSELPRVTISAGVAAYPEHGRQVQDLLKAADAALYMAKEQGRNRVCVGAAH
jgi:diguanylate cyclase (GGDEF)-like protein